MRSLLSGGGSIAVAMGVMNVATYGFTMIAARLLGPKSYGAFASLMATLLVVTVLQLGLQATAARRIAAEPEHVAQIEQTILGVTYRAAVALGVLLLVLTPLLNQILRLDSLATAALVSVVSVPFTIMGGQAGILQGERRWTALVGALPAQRRAAAGHRHRADRLAPDRVRRAGRHRHRRVRPGRRRLVVPAPRRATPACTARTTASGG